MIRNRSWRWPASLLIIALLVTGLIVKRQQIYLAWKYPTPSRDTRWISDYGYSQSGILDFTFGAGFIGIPLVEARVEGAKTRLILDTGTRAVASLKDSVIRGLDLNIVDHVNWRDSSGAVQASVPVVRLKELSVGPLTVRDATVSGMGPESIMGDRSGYDGTLGWAALIEHRLTIDYSNRLLAFSDQPLPASLSSCKTRHVADMVWNEKLPGLVLLSAKWGDRDVLAQLDTGKSSTVYDPAVIAAADLEAQRVLVGSLPVPVRHARFHGLQNFSPSPEAPPVALGLGSDFLAQYLVTIDYPARKVMLEAQGCH